MGRNIPMWECWNIVNGQRWRYGMTESILVVGKENCSRCDMVKNILTNKKIEFSYVKLEELSQEEKSEYLKMARDVKQLEMPIIIKDNNVITLQEVK